MKTYLNALGIICSLGYDKASTAVNLFDINAKTLTNTDKFSQGLTLPLGIVNQQLPIIPSRLSHHQSRNNQMCLAALRQIDTEIKAAINEYGSDRLAVVIGTSTSGIAEGEAALRYKHEHGTYPTGYTYQQQEMSSCSSFIAELYGIIGLNYTISTACSSSANALASARRLLQNDLCDAVIVGGCDSLCELTVRGFHALESVSPYICQPFSNSREGINIGEGAALFLMTRTPTDIALLGTGASSDAHHISAPEPNGTGAQQAMRAALKDANLESKDIHYLNLHGTATKQNDSMEARAVTAVFDSSPACSSTKPLTGHTLGAAGALEAAFCWLTLSSYNPDRLLPPHHWDNAIDVNLPPLNFVDNRQISSPLRYCMSNSFAFGGNNATLIMGLSNAH